MKRKINVLFLDDKRGTPQVQRFETRKVVYYDSNVYNLNP